MEVTSAAVEAHTEITVEVVQQPEPTNPSRPTRGDNTRRTILAAAALYIADKAVGGIIGDAATDLLSKLSTPAPTVVTATGRAAAGQAIVKGVGEVVSLPESLRVVVRRADGSEEERVL